MAPGLQIHKFVVGFSAAPTHPGVEFEFEVELLDTPGVEAMAAVAALAAFALVSLLLVLDLAVSLGKWLAIASSEVPNLSHERGEKGWT